MSLKIVNGLLLKVNELYKIPGKLQKRSCYFNINVRKDSSVTFFVKKKKNNNEKKKLENIKYRILLWVTY